MEESLKTLSQCSLWREHLLIFVCLGTKRFSFDRLITKLDELVENGQITEDVIVQLGHTNYVPKYLKYKRFMSPEEYEDYLYKASLIISHGGTGAIVKALKAHKQVIAVPRLEKYGEHSDDHQLQIVTFFEENGYVYRVDHMDELLSVIENIQEYPIKKRFKGDGRIVNIIDEYIQNTSVF